jgi:penicillin-binding protein 2
MAVDNPALGGTRKGYMRWKQYLNDFGMGARLGVDLPGEDRGLVPDTSVYNKEYRGSWSSCTNLTLGIGQDKMLATPLQLANAMCIIANKGYFYTPHLVNTIDDPMPEDTAYLNPYKSKHEVLTHIPDNYFQAVMDGMEDVVTSGTGRNALIKDIRVCAKTGTAEKFKILEGRKIQLEDNAVFVCFAPRDNPKIAIAVVVENAGFGGTWGGPIARILMEKYLNDTLTKQTVADYERISNTNKMPAYLKREQQIVDSVRAFEWFKMTKDSAYIRKYVYTPMVPLRKDAPARQQIKQHEYLVWTEPRRYFHPNISVPLA